jgi:ankyrin repeat protein
MDVCCSQPASHPPADSVSIYGKETACLPGADCHDVKGQHAVYSKMLQYCETGNAAELTQLINARRLCLGCLDRQFNPGSNNLSFLNTAAKFGYSDVAQALIWGGLHPDHRCMRSGTTALFDGAYLGHAQFVRKLLEMKADPFIEDTDGSNAVYAACYSGQVGVLKELIDFGVRVHYARHSDLRTPLHAAAGGGHLDCLRKLIAAKHPLNCIDEDGLTPLLLAAANGCCDGRKECILALVDAKCDVHLTDYKGRNVLATILLNPTGCSQCIMHASQTLLALEPPVSICCRDCEGMSIASELRKLKGKSYGKGSILQTTLQSHPNMQFMFNRALLKEEMRAKLELKQRASCSKRFEQGKSLEEQVKEAEAAAAALILDEEESSKKKKKKGAKVKEPAKDVAAISGVKDDRALDNTTHSDSKIDSVSKSHTAAAASTPPSAVHAAVKERSHSPVHCDR